jgi:hypothetical protein
MIYMYIYKLNYKIRRVWLKSRVFVRNQVITYGFKMIITYLLYSWNDQYYNNNFMLYCNLPTAYTKKIRKKYLRQPSIDFDFFIVSSSCDVVYRERWFTQAGYWFILRFCEHLLVWVAKLQNAIKMENISNLITSPSSYQCRKTTKARLVHFVIRGRHTSMEYMCAYWGSPKVNFQNKWKKTNLVTVLKGLNTFFPEFIDV